MLLGTAISFRRNKSGFEGLVLGTALYSGLLQLQRSPGNNRGRCYVTTSSFASDRPWCRNLYLCIFNPTLRCYLYFFAKRLLIDHLKAIWQISLIMERHHNVYAGNYQFDGQRSSRISSSCKKSMSALLCESTSRVSVITGVE